VAEHIKYHQVPEHLLECWHGSTYSKSHADGDAPVSPLPGKVLLGRIAARSLRTSAVKKRHGMRSLVRMRIGTDTGERADNQPNISLVDGFF